MKKKKKKFKLSQLISYTSDCVMFAIILIWFAAVIYSAIISGMDTDQLCYFVDLVKVPVEVTVGGYFGRIALTHFMSMYKTGKGVAKDIASEYAGSIEPISEEEN